MLNKNLIKVVTIEKGIQATKQIDDSLETLQKIVKGHIEIPYVSSLAEKEIDMILNDEGKLRSDCLPTGVCVTTSNEIVDIIFGNIIFASHDQEGQTTSLNENQIAFINQIPRGLLEMNGKRHAVIVIQV